MDQRDDSLVFGRYSREECGLPPPEGAPARRRLVVGRAVLLFAALLSLGWLAGTAASRMRERWVAALPSRIAGAGPAESADLLAKGRVLAASLPDHALSAHSLALAAMMAAEKAPRRLGYFGSLGAMLDNAPDWPDAAPDEAFMAGLAAAWVYSELGQYGKAFANLEKADAALRNAPDDAAKRARRLHLVNTQAYLLATAPESEGGNPEKALHLSQLLVSSRDEIAPGKSASASPAFLDTLASAWHAAGEAEKAVVTQTFALGLAESAELAVYLRHYDEFVRAAARAERSAFPEIRRFDRNK